MNAYFQAIQWKNMLIENSFQSYFIAHRILFSCVVIKECFVSDENEANKKKNEKWKFKTNYLVVKCNKEIQNGLQ